MTSSSTQPEPAPGVTSRERIDALLDEALMESFPASDSSAIGSGTTAIKQNHRELHATAESTPQLDAGRQTISGATT